MINKYKNWLYLTGFFLILVLPLLIIPPLFHPASWGKTIVFRIILSFLIFLFIYQISKGTEFLKLRSSVPLKVSSNRAFWPFWLLIALLGIFFLATIFSSDIYFSLWGSPNRGGGFVSLASYIIFAILAFLILSRGNWQKIWDFSIFIGILVSTVAIFQQFGLFSKTLIPFSGRPPSTMGGPMFLALYLLLLVFITFSFLLKEKEKKKKLFYFLGLSLFVYVILITGTRAAYFGLLIGFVYFIFNWQKNFFPLKRKGLLIGLKILFLLLLIISAYGVYYLNTQSELPNYLKENKIVQGVLSRLSINIVLAEPRFSTWVISLEAVRQKPILGYGPENFSIGFDKYYDPALPYIDINWGSWWDRAHNFIFDISVTAGIPALIIYLSLFASLFWGLQKIKKKRPEQALVCHGIQATFFAYLAANLFTFDLFSSYLISFLLIAYSLHLISFNADEIEIDKKPIKTTAKWRKPILAFILIVLIWFVWSFNIKPLRINAEINEARRLVNNKKCDQGLEKMEKALSQKSFIDSFLRLKYIEFMKDCAGFYPEKNLEYAKKGIEALKYNIEIQPKFTRNWILLGSFTNLLIEEEKNPEKRQNLVKQIEYYFEKAQELSPKHQEIFIEWAKTYLVAEDYQKMKEKSQECINLNPGTLTCHWYLGLSEIFLGGNELNEKAEKYLALAETMAYRNNTFGAFKAILNQLALAYGSNENYEKLVMVYQKLIKLNPQEPLYHSSLGFIYRELGEYEKAKEQALIFLELKPEAREEVEFFLKTLK